MKKEFASGIRTALLTAAAAVIMGGAAFGAEGGDVLPQVLLNSQWDWYSTGEPTYKDLFHNQYELARLDRESAAVYPELDSALKDWSAEKQADEENYNSYMHELADDYNANGAQVLPLKGQSDLYVRRADEKVLSLLELSSSYEGGVHGMYGFSGYNFDSRTGEKLTLDSVFRNTEDLPGLIAGSLWKTYPEKSFFSPDETLAEDYAKGRYKDWNWTLDPNGVTFYFAPYYLASYADGALEAFIPFRGNESIFTGAFGEQTGAWAMGMPDYFTQNYMKSDGMYHLMIKKEGGTPGIFTSLSKQLTGPWPEPDDRDYVNFEGRKKCEGPSAFQLIGEDTWRVGYIEYSSNPKHYRICQADAYLRNFHDPVDIEGVTGPQHGSFLRLTKKEYKRLQRWSERHSQ
jgi:hypothetical protein